MWNCETTESHPWNHKLFVTPNLKKEKCTQTNMAGEFFSENCNFLIAIFWEKKKKKPPFYMITSIHKKQQLDKPPLFFPVNKAIPLTVSQKDMSNRMSDISRGQSFVIFSRTDNSSVLYFFIIITGILDQVKWK